MEQPRVYNTEDELIKWLKYDLKEQRRETAELEEAILGEKIPLKKVEERYLTLNIGVKIDNISDNYTEYIIINFEFNLNDIIYKLFDKLSYEDIDCYINCNRLIFNNEANFSNASFKNKVSFMVSKFIDNINFSNTTFKNEINLYGVLFNKDIDLYMTLFNNESNFSWAIFNNEVDFSNASFDNEVDFSYSTFNNGVCFSEVLFNRAKFLDSNFYYDKNKCKDNINNKINFSHITINDYLELDNTNIQDDTEIIFDNMIFKDNKSYLSIMNIKKEINKLSLKDITIDGRINIQNVEVETVDFKGSVINSGLVNPVNFKVNNFANRESALFLKNEAYARNNIIDALEYKAKEIEMHKENLLKNSKDYKDWGDIISIELSSLYSDNGLNWIKSFLCTILFSILFFTLSYNISCIPIFIIAFISFLYVLFYNKNISNRIFISAITYIIISIVFSFIYFEGYNNINYTIKELFSFIAPTNFSQILYDKGGLSYIYNSKNIFEIIFKGIFYFLGKIAFWYGSVQTVQSFRKFSKKE